MALGQIQLDVNSFAGYGPHTVTVGCHLAAGDAPLFIEFIPELQAANSQAIPGKVALTSEQPSANWGYVAISPFHPGYCFRVAAAPGNPPVSWSVPRSSDAPLTLDLNGAVIPDSGLTSSNTSSPGAPVAGASDSDPVPSLVS
jgi:hypothetical protein